MTLANAFVISFCYVAKCNTSKKKAQYSGEKWNYIDVVWAHCAKGLIPSFVCMLLSEIFTVTSFGRVWPSTGSAICAALGMWLLYLNPWNCEIKRNAVTGCGQRACVTCLTSGLGNRVRVWRRYLFNAFKIHQTTLVFFDRVMILEPGNQEPLCGFKTEWEKNYLANKWAVQGLNCSRSRF